MTDLVTLDFSMPEKDDGQVFKKMRKENPAIK